MPILDKSLFPRLKRLFSTGVIIRNVGGTSLKVSDPDNIQSLGYLQTNSLTDRFTRLYKAGGRLQYNPLLNYQTLRIQLYSEYEAMDTDAFVSPALDMIADDCTGRGENGEILSIKSTNENVQAVLYNLFYEVLNIEFTLRMWVRNMCKYGDTFIHLDIAENFGVYNATPLSVYDIIREEGLDPENPLYVCFRVDPVALAGGTAVGNNYNKKKYENYEIAHFRNAVDSNYLPYGRSVLEPARKIWKQMTLLEDAVLLHRITRSADKRIFYINVGNIPANEVDNYMQLIVEKNKRTPYVNPDTGDYNLKFNVMNLMEDFYIPIRGTQNDTKIENISGLEYTGMDDVVYLRDKMFAALKVPKDRLNFTEDVNGKSTLAAIGVNFARTIETLQRTVVSELKKIAQIHLYVQGFEEDLDNFELRLHNPSIIYKQEQVALLKEQIDLYNLIKEAKILSTDYFLGNIMELSEDEILAQRELILEDQKREFRMNQILEEGNDPAITGESYGTPHDLATLYGQTRYAKPDVPDGYDPNKPGTPKINMSTIGTDNSAFGRDPLGKKGALEKYRPEKPKNAAPGNGPLKLNEQQLTPEQRFRLELAKIKLEKRKSKITEIYPRKITLFENKEDDSENTFLDEDNIKSEDNS